jgi:hypothetical protein
MLMFSRVIANACASRDRAKKKVSRTFNLPEVAKADDAVAGPTASEIRDLEYFFEAQVVVDGAKWAVFDQKHNGQGGPLLVEIHRSVNLVLVHSCVEPRDSSMKFFNYWHMGRDANALTIAEMRLSDNVTFAEFDQLVQRDEDKDIMFPASFTAVDIEEMQALNPKALQKFKAETARYVRIVYDVSVRFLPDFAARVEAALEPFGLERGWLLGSTYVHLTGDAGRVVQLWLIPAAFDEDHVQKVAKEMPWRTLDDRKTSPFREGRKEPRIMFLHPTPFDPTIIRLKNLDNR